MHPRTVVHWRVEWLLWTTIVKDGGSHSEKQRHLLLHLQLLPELHQ